MKIVLDTNVLISATFWKGAPDKVVCLVEQKKVDLVLSGAIIQEYAGVLNSEEILGKITANFLEINRAVEKIFSMAIIVDPIKRIHVLTEDPDDNMILECAKEGCAQVSISDI